MGAEGLSVIAPPKDAPVCPPAGRLHDDIAASSTEGAVLTSKVNRFGKWSTFSGNGKPKAENNGKNGQPKSGKVSVNAVNALNGATFHT